MEEIICKIILDINGDNNGMMFKHVKPDYLLCMTKLDRAAGFCVSARFCSRNVLAVCNEYGDFIELFRDLSADVQEQLFNDFKKELNERKIEISL